MNKHNTRHFSLINALIIIGALFCFGHVRADDTIVATDPPAKATDSPAKAINSRTTEKIGFTYTVGANIVSSYLWRGFAVGGLSFQPDFNIGYGGLSIGAWWNIGATDHNFRKFFPEVDVYLRFSRWGFTIDLVHMHYFNSKFFDFSQKSIYGKGNANNTELHLSYRISDKIPFIVEWYTHIGSEDGYVVDQQGNFLCKALSEGADPTGKSVKRAFSSYLQLGYDFALPYDITIPIRLGMTPWRSRYTQYEGTFAVCCISASIEKVFRFEHFNLKIFGRAMFNPDRVNKDNIIVNLWQRNWQVNQYNSHLNGTLGVGIWL